MNKLVRDNIPELIVKSGKTCTFRTLKDNEILNVRQQKVLEELDELKEAVIAGDTFSILEELGDVVLIAHFYMYGQYDGLNQLEISIEDKKFNKGSFENNYFIEKVE